MTSSERSLFKGSLASRQLPLASGQHQCRVLDDLPLDRTFSADLERCGLSPLRPRQIEIFQINLGKMCNQTCRHCHVDAGPDRREVMSRETMEQCLAALGSTSIPVVDLTGGAPEMNPHFRWFVQECRKLGRRVIDRCNLTILETPLGRDLPEFLGANQVEVVASLPHYRALNTDRQRGDGVFESSLAGLRRLNAVGYAQPGTGLVLCLITNPVGAFLPVAQAVLEPEWKREMSRLHQIQFDRLYCITNMPISRFLEWLTDSENLESYMRALLAAFNPAAADAVMCRNTISVGWDGRLYDCDFNQMLDLGLAPTAPSHVAGFDLAALENRVITVGQHCYGCTAGSGSSCTGKTTSGDIPAALTPRSLAPISGR